MKVRSPRTKKITIIIAGVITLFAASGYAFIFYTIKSFNNQASLLRQEISLKEEKEKKSIFEKILLRDLEKERKELDGYFIERDNPVVLIEKIEEIGKISGVSLSISSLEPDKERKNIIIADMSLAGSFPKIFHFLSLLEKTPLGVTVKRAAFGIAVFPLGAVIPFSWEGVVRAEISHFIN